MEHLWGVGAKNAEPNGALPRREQKSEKSSGSGLTEEQPRCGCSGPNLQPVLELLQQVLEQNRQMIHLLMHSQAPSDDPDAEPTHYLDGTPIR